MRDSETGGFLILGVQYRIAFIADANDAFEAVRAAVYAQCQRPQVQRLSRLVQRLIGVGANLIMGQTGTARAGRNAFTRL